ncbi:alpha/beta fold hydrolase [Donghicola sp. C2-DW-16]|uniref:Alpha/beta fold hydrolase n=1 Tax=Donghicola mangrovi TaxID=2729614 RepID=A0ABX2PGW1_9RHOB|nr:alpha/beta fold hydrolase [Donghicola mangrovi]NVO27829.1 alpha/beta fold hydrolase [Donghicola mangrovi]
MSWRKLAFNTLAVVGIATITGCVAVERRAESRELRSETRTPPIGEFINLDDGRRVHAWVQGSGPDVVLIHGASGNLRDMTFDLAGRLTDRYRVIAFDRPAMGYTDRADPRYNTIPDNGAETVQEQAQMLQLAADKLGVQRPIVLGHSFGGSVALAWALERPEETGGLIVVSGASHPWPGGLGPSYTIPSSSLGGRVAVPLVSALMPQKLLKTMVDGVFRPQSAPEGYADYLGGGLALRPDTLRANARQLTTLKPQLAQMVTRYPTLSMPVEIIHGDADDTVPIHIHAIPLSQQIPNAHLTVLPGIGHMPHHTSATEVVAAIDRAAARAGLHPAP